MIRPPLPLLERLPYKPRKLDNAKAMTIAIAMRCEDGCVFCTDTQISHGLSTEYGAFAHFERKIHGTEGHRFAAGLCAAGEASLIKPFAQSLMNRLQRRKDSDEREREQNPEYEKDLIDSYLQGWTWEGSNEAAVNAELEGLATRIGRNPELATVIGFADVDNRLQLIKTDGLVTCAAGPLEILGIGEMSLVHYLTDSMYRPRMSMQHGAALAIFVVAVAKKYCPQYCSGSTDVSLLCTDRAKPRWGRMSPSTVTELEEFFWKSGCTHLRKLLDEAAEKL
jgi:20S proteasome alpha/beta subunit